MTKKNYLENAVFATILCLGLPLAIVIGAALAG